MNPSVSADEKAALLAPATCACFPGTCRGGQVINGKTAAGLLCKASKPAALSHYSQMAIDAIAEAAQADASRLAARVIGGAL